MKIGVIAVGRDCADVMDAVLAPWIEAMARHDIRMCLLSATFKGMEGILPPAPDAATVDRMMDYHRRYMGHINAVAFDGYMTEAEVRDAGRRMLMSKNVDLIILLDLSDEYYTARDIDRILSFVDRNPFVASFKGSFKNYVFDDKTYLVEPFQPARIWRTVYGDRVLTRVVYDNDCEYARPDGAAAVRDTALPQLTIPPAIAWVKHLTWPSNERGHSKQRYQEARWSFKEGRGNGCSYAWDDAKGRLVFNPEWYARNRLPLPEVARDDS